MRSFRPALAALAVLSVLAVPRGAAAQGFGKNKVQYETLRWSVLETPHVRLHFYAQEESLARKLAVFAESVCVEYDGRFQIRPIHHVPFLLYSAHYLFQQTNATPDMITEGVGGLTELVKGRVMVPHNGSWARLEWVTRHELTHWYMMEKIQTVMHAHHRAQPYMPPLWFVEGLAEYCGTHWDEDAEGMLRDAVTSGEARQITHSDDITGTVLMYKEGQSFLYYLRDNYGGDAQVFAILENWWRAEDFETAFRLTLGVPLEEVDVAWWASLRRRYYPEAAAENEPREVAQRLTHRGRFNLGPRVVSGGAESDSTLKFCFFEASEDGIKFMVSEPGPNHHRNERLLLTGGLTPSYESFHLFENRPQVSASGRIVLASRHEDRDALYQIDSNTGQVLRRSEFPGLVIIHDPCLVPGDSAVVFSAQDISGRSDLYRVTWPGGVDRLERLTDDDYDDLEPDVSPDGRWVAFASDRGDRAGHYDLFRLSLAGGAPERLGEAPAGDDRQPVYSPDGKWLAFRSTRGGTSDLWVRPAEPDTVARRVTRLIGPASDPDWLPGGRGLLFTAEQGISFQTYSIRFSPDSLKIEHEKPGPRVPVLTDIIHEEPAQPYERHLSLDLVQNAVVVNPATGAGAAAQIALSDVLGDEQYQIYIANDSGTFGTGFWDGFEGSVTYLNQKQRLNYGLGVFRLTELYDADLDALRLEPRVGMLGLVSYPLSEFDRIEASVVLRHADNHLLRNGQIYNENLLSNYLTLVRDNVGWTYMGPSFGTRMFLSAGFTRDLTYAQGDYYSLGGELRHYEKPVPGVVWAQRIQETSSLGRDAQRYYLGGYGSIAGYDWRTISGLHTVLVEEELRGPLLRRLVLSIPSPWALPPVGGAAFVDGAWTWDRILPQHVGSAGLAVFIGGGYYPVFRWDFAWLTNDFTAYSPRPVSRFWIGFNY